MTKNAKTEQLRADFARHDMASSVSAAAGNSNVFVLCDFWKWFGQNVIRFCLPPMQIGKEKKRLRRLASI